MQPIEETQHPLPEKGSEEHTHSRFSLPPLSHSSMAPRWAAILGMLAIGVIYVLLPEELTIGPSWLLLVVEGILILPFVVVWLMRRRFPPRAERALALIILGVVTVALAGGIAFLISSLPHNKQAGFLLRSAGLIWFFNVFVFALWYWEIDGGGPRKRHQSGHLAADFMFPQQADGKPGTWVPHFLDYLFLAFTAATALSPADTFPLTRKAKGLMMIEAVLSMVTIVLLAGRAVNIL